MSPAKASIRSSIAITPISSRFAPATSRRRTPSPSIAAIASDSVAAARKHFDREVTIRHDTDRRRRALGRGAGDYEGPHMLIAHVLGGLMKAHVVVDGDGVTFTNGSDVHRFLL